MRICRYYIAVRKRKAWHNISSSCMVNRTWGFNYCNFVKAKGYMKCQDYRWIRNAEWIRRFVKREKIKRDHEIYFFTFAETGDIFLSTGDFIPMSSRMILEQIRNEND